MENLISSSYRNFLLGLIFLLKTKMKEFSTKMKKNSKSVMKILLIMQSSRIHMVRKTFSLLNIMIIQMKELLAFYYDYVNVNV